MKLPHPFPASVKARLLEILQGASWGGRSWWLTRFLILRLLGLVYLVAFLVLAHQALPLIGEKGILPAGLYLERVEDNFGSRGEAFLQVPSIFWLRLSDPFLLFMAWTGVGLSLVVLLGFANGLVLLLLWALYMSFVHIGQLWYGYGWEFQLIETGFLAVFLCPFLDPRPFPRRPPPALVLWLFRWLTFRIMLGAGLIKLRGDSCWRDLTALYYHYETQPIPNPLSRTFHFFPHWCQKFGVLWNHFIEVVAPWLGFGPKLARRIAGALLLSFQVTLILSGNLSFLNWLTIVPILACFDDALLSRVLPRRLDQAARRAAENARPGRVQPVLSVLVFCLVGFLSYAPVANLFSSRQIMNTSFNRLHLVNTYGAFGSVGRERREIVFEGTSEAQITPGTGWKEYQFKAKPGDPLRRPPWISPYHYRLDWQIWFAAMASPKHYPWTIHFVWKLLQNDPGVLSLLAENPFPDEPPKFIRAVLYRYQFAPAGSPEGAIWKRTRLGNWLPPLSTENPGLRDFLITEGWLRE